MTSVLKQTYLQMPFGPILDASDREWT
jgi:hypothetical protein